MAWAGEVAMLKVRNKNGYGMGRGNRNVKGEE
jgi:hypothetical protein